MNITATLLEHKAKKNGKCPVSITISFSGKRLRVQSSVDATPEEWNKSSRKLRSSAKNHHKLNLILQREIARCNDIMIHYKLMEREPTAKEFYRIFHNPGNEQSFVAWMHEKIVERRKKEMISEGTAKIHHTAIQQYFLKYDKQWLFSDITIKRMDDFMAWVYKKTASVNTASKYMRAIKSYVSIAVKEELLSDNPFQSLKIKSGKERIVYLTREELKKLDSHFRTKQLTELQRTAAFNFLAAFYLCGIRRSDFKALTFDHIFSETIVFNEHKGRRFNKVVKLPLSAQAKRYIKEAAGFRVQGKIFRCFSDQRENVALKEVARLAGIEKSISFHVARHTFATLFLEETNDLATLQQLMTHSNISETMKYVHVSERKKQEQSQRFFKSI